MACNNCKTAESTGVESIPYVAYEATMDRSERTVRRLIAGLIATVLLVFASNAIWLWAWLQYDYYVEGVTINSEDGGNANHIGRDGDIINGISDNPEG